VLAVAVDALSIVTGPLARRVAVKHLDLVSLDPGHALLILVLDATSSASTRWPSAVRRPGGVEPARQWAQRRDRRLDGAQIESSPGSPPVHPLRSELVADIAAFLHSVESREDTLIVHDGVRNLLHQPEFGDVQRLAQVLELVEEERVLGELLAAAFEGAGSASDQGCRWRRAHRASGYRGDRHRVRDLAAERLQPGVDHLPGRRGEGGTVGVLGPTRMPYSQVAPRVRFVAIGWRSGDAGTQLTMSADRGDRG